MGDKVVGGNTILAQPGAGRHLNVEDASEVRRNRREDGHDGPLMSCQLYLPARNMLLGFVAILQAFEGAFEAEGGDFSVNPHFIIAAKRSALRSSSMAGRVRRAHDHTTSDFGRELDSLADMITFGIAPAVLAFVWGVLFVISPMEVLAAT